MLGGTAAVQGGASGFFLHTSVLGASTGANDIYSVTATNTTAVARQVVAQAICARVAG